MLVVSVDFDASYWNNCHHRVFFVKYGVTEILTEQVKNNKLLSFVSNDESNDNGLVNADEFLASTAQLTTGQPSVGIHSTTAVIALATPVTAH